MLSRIKEIVDFLMNYRKFPFRKKNYVRMLDPYQDFFHEGQFLGGTGANLCPLSEKHFYPTLKTFCPWGITVKRVGQNILL